MRLVDVVVDETLEAGTCRVGGVRILDLQTSEEFRRAIDTVLVACPSEEAASAMRARIHADAHLELAEKSEAPREHDCRYGCCKAGDVFLYSEVIR